MFWPNIATLDAFYTSPPGQVAYTHIRQVIGEFWQKPRYETIVGLGFAAHYLSDFIDNYNKVIAVMPAVQGVMHWPEGKDNLSCMADEAELPFADHSVDKIMLIHVLEYSDQSKAMMRELWRVLSPTGKLLIVMPNRLGLWSHIEKTPFGHGHPFNIMQITSLLHETQFTPLRSTSTLFMPPSFPSSAMIEKLGKRWLQPFGGVLITEAEKQVYSVIPPKVSITDKLRTYVLSPEGRGAYS